MAHFPVVLQLRTASLTQYIFQLALQYKIFGAPSHYCQHDLQILFTSLIKPQGKALEKLNWSLFVLVLFKLYQINNYIIKYSDFFFFFFLKIVNSFGIAKAAHIFILLHT